MLTVPAPRARARRSHGIAAAVDVHEAAVGREHVLVGGDHLAVELERLALDAIGGARLASRRRLLRADGQEHGGVRHQAARTDVVDRAHGLGADSAHHSLVDERAAHVAVGDHERAALQRRGDHVLHELRARRREQQRLGRALTGAVPSSTIARTLSPVGVPPGSRTSTTSAPAHADARRGHILVRRHDCSPRICVRSEPMSSSARAGWDADGRIVLEGSEPVSARAEAVPVAAARAPAGGGWDGRGRSWSVARTVIADRYVGTHSSTRAW